MPFAPGFFTEAPHKPRLALSLRLLAREVDRTWPKRSTGSDGWLGDAAHQARESRHNPDALGIVRALDVTAKGIQPRVLVTAALNHPAVEHVIWNHTIWSRRWDFEPRLYDGPDPHVGHVHIDIGLSDTHSSSRQEWHLA